MMPTDDLDPRTLPDARVPSGPVIVGLPASSGLDEFASESDAPTAVIDIAVVTAVTAEAPARPSISDAIEGPVDHTQQTAGRAVTLLDVLERRDATDWREAVAIVHKLCLQLKDSPSEHPLVLEPRNILLTAGEVRVVPGSHGGDPLVIQVGRLLRMLLLNKPVPPELRLIMSQATFELPIFDSVEDVARALAAVSRGPENDAVESAYGKALRPIVATPFETVSDLPAPRPILPVPRRRRRALTSRFPYSKDDVLLAATVLVGAAVCVGLIANQWISRTQITVRPTTTVITSTAENRRPVAGPPAGTSPPQNGAPTAVPPLRVGPTQDRARQVPSRPAQQPAGTASTATTLPAPVVVRPDGGRPTPREMARRAAALVEAGKPSEAEVAFDAFVLNNPLYEPAPSELGPEAYAISAARRLRSSKATSTARWRSRATLTPYSIAPALKRRPDCDHKCRSWWTRPSTREPPRTALSTPTPTLTSLHRGRSADSFR
jgi:hypothetical protein